MGSVEVYEQEFWETQMRLRVEYFDQNEEFARCLPRLGTVSLEFRDSKGAGPWYLFTLEEPFEHQLKSGEPSSYNLVKIDAFLIRSRWDGRDVGDAEGVSVFLLLVEEGQHPIGPTINLDEFVHIAWGMCRPEA